MGKSNTVLLLGQVNEPFLNNNNDNNNNKKKKKKKLRKEN